MANFYLICGMSGGGKTVLTDRIVRLNKGLVMLDVDEYYSRINGDDRDRSHMFEVWHTLFKDIHDLEMQNKDVVLTTNSLTRSQRDQFVEWFPSFDHHCIWVMAEKERCYEGNCGRHRVVPKDKFEAMWDRMEPPTSAEKLWVSIAYVTNWWTGEYTTFDVKGNVRSLIDYEKENIDNE